MDSRQILADLKAIMDRMNEQTPAWVSHPKGRLELTDWLNGKEQQVFVVQNPALHGLTWPGEPAEPFVLMARQTYQQIQFMLLRAGVRVTDRQLASFFVYKAEAERMLERGVALSGNGYLNPGVMS